MASLESVLRKFHVSLWVGLSRVERRSVNPLRFRNPRLPTSSVHDGFGQIVVCFCGIN